MPLPAKTRQEKGPGRRLANRPAAVASSPITISSESEDESILNKPKFTKSHTRAIVISSDESDDDVQLGPSVQIPSLLPSTVYKQADLASSLPHAPYLELHTKSKQRQLTPIRRGNRQVPAILSPSSSLSSDLDEIFADISISSGLEDSLPAPPKYLLPLLSECRQSVPHEFSAFIETFPFDPIIRYSDQGYASKAEFRKIGEASYSEVFRIGNVVLKIVPLRDEEASHSDFLEVDSPPPSDAQDVLKEINVTRSMGEICEGFIKLLRAYVVRGKYPSLLLSCWDEFNETKGSESIKPGQRHSCHDGFF
jgi:serine/threonine-protein kinase haspin